MLYTVKFVGMDRRIASNTVDADSASSARLRVERQPVTVLSVVPAPWYATLVAPRPAKFPLQLFTQELLSLLESGVSVVEAMKTLAEKESQPAALNVMATTVQALQEGKALSAALLESPHAFNPLYVAMVSASEKTGSLNDALRRYNAYASQLENLRTKLVGAAIYPVMLIGVSMLVILFLMGYVIPRFAHIYEDMGNQLPWMSRVLMYGGQGIDQHWLLLLSLLVLGVLVLRRGGAGYVQKLVSSQLWRFPKLAQYSRIFQLVRMYRTMGMLLRGGIAVVQASEMVAGLLSNDMRADLQKATALVSEGRSMSQSFESCGLTTPVALRLLRVGESAGNMGEMMERVAAFHDEEITRWADWLTRVIGPVLMLIMGLIIGLIVVLMYLPIFQLAESVR
jgi:general secretion pathway protein F